MAFGPLPADRATAAGLQAGQGLLASGTPLAGLTADKAGLKQGDVILKVNGQTAVPQGFSLKVRDFKVGEPVTFTVQRDGKSLELKAPLTEKPRDPGNANFEVIYSHVVSNGKRMRTIITKPKKPGKHPALFFMQGLAPLSYDFNLETSTGDVSTLDGPILFEFANSNYVTLRVEKPGVGDSEGGPYTELDFNTETDIYRQALKQLKETGGVDTGNIFIFGHSMGGSFGPIVATEIPVKGICVYGVASRTWFEYVLDIMRYQGLVAGDNYEAADDRVRAGAKLMSQLFLDNKSLEQVKKDNPELTGMADSMFPGGLFNGKNLTFWRQLVQVNHAKYWAKTNAHVLAVRGASDFVTYDVDHKLIADIVNRANPGYGKWEVLPASDHLFHNWATEPESMKNFQFGKFNPAFTKLMKSWIEEVIAKS